MKHTGRNLWGYSHALQKGLGLSSFFLQFGIILVKCCIFLLVRLQKSKVSPSHASPHMHVPWCLQSSVWNVATIGAKKSTRDYLDEWKRVFVLFFKWTIYSFFFFKFLLSCVLGAKCFFFFQALHFWEHYSKLHKVTAVSDNRVEIKSCYIFSLKMMM